MVGPSARGRCCRCDSETVRKVACKDMMAARFDSWDSANKREETEIVHRDDGLSEPPTKPEYSVSVSAFSSTRVAQIFRHSTTYPTNSTTC